MTEPEAGTTRNETDARSVAGPSLFGRGLLYVIIWALQLVVGTLVSPILAYTLGPVEFGALASAIALHQLLTVIAVLGLDQAVVLQRAEGGGSGAKGLLTVGITVAAVISGVAVATAPLWRGALGFGDYPMLVVAVVLWTAPAAAVQVMLALLLTEDRIKSFAVISAVAAVGGQLTGITLLFTVRNDALTYAWGGVASQLAAFLIGVIATKPKLRGLIEWSITWRALKLGVPLVFGGLAYFVLNAGDRVVIQSMLGAGEVGRYQVAYVVGSVIILLLVFTNSAWTPRFAAVSDLVERFELAMRSRDELYRLLIPAILGITLAAPMLLRVVAPATFHPETLGIVVFVVVVSALPVAAGGATVRLLITSRRGKVIALASGIAAVVNIVLNVLLLPLMGILGAAIATLAAYTLVACIQRFAMPQVPRWKRAPNAVIWGVVASVGISAGSLLLPQSIEWNIGRLIVALACLPWFFLRLKKARTSIPVPEPEPATTDTQDDRMRPAL